MSRVPHRARRAILLIAIALGVGVALRAVPQHASRAFAALLGNRSACQGSTGDARPEATQLCGRQESAH